MRSAGAGEPSEGCAEERRPVDEKGERIYQITNIYEEKAEELLIVELYTGIHLENGVPCGHFTLYLCGEPDGWKLSETRMMEYLQNL